MDERAVRDRFAAAAMVAIGHPTLLARIVQSGDVPKAVAEACYRIADAMMAERAKNAPEGREGGQEAGKEIVATSGSTGGGA